MSVTLHLQCNVTGCTARASRIVSTDIREELRASGWRSENGADLCPSHANLQVVTGGGGGGGGSARPIPEPVHAVIATGGAGGSSQDAEIVRLRRESAKRRRDELAIRDHFPEVAAIDRDDSVRALLVHARYLSNSLAAVQSLIPADILEDGDTVDGVRRLAAEHQQLTAAHAKAADDRDLYLSQRNELDAELKQRRDTTTLIADIYATLLPRTPGLAVEQVPQVVRDLLGERAAYAAQRDNAWSHLRAIREALGAPFDIDNADLPNLLRKLRQDRDELAEQTETTQHDRAFWPWAPYVEQYANFDNPSPYSMDGYLKVLADHVAGILTEGQKAAALNPRAQQVQATDGRLITWDVNEEGGEAFIPLAPKRAPLTNADAEQCTPVAEHPRCDHCDKPDAGRWTVPHLKTTDGNDTTVCLDCLRVLNGGKL